MWNRKPTPAASIALGGVLSALAVVIMGLGGMLSVATYVCPVAAMLLLKVVLMVCGEKMAWAFYGAVSILSLLICPDKEAAAVFLFLGFYPILKPRLDQSRFPWLMKAVFFNGDILLLYWLLLHLMGMNALQQEFAEMGTALILTLLLLGNLVFFMLDFILGRRVQKRK